MSERTEEVNIKKSIVDPENIETLLAEFDEACPALAPILRQHAEEVGEERLFRALVDATDTGEFSTLQEVLRTYVTRFTPASKEFD